MGKSRQQKRREKELEKFYRFCADKGNIDLNSDECAAQAESLGRAFAQKNQWDNFMQVHNALICEGRILAVAVPEAEQKEKQARNRKRKIKMILCTIVIFVLMAALSVTIVHFRNKHYYNLAQSAVENGNHAKAYFFLQDTILMSEAAALKNMLETEHPYVKYLEVNVGETIVLGEYEQDNNTANGKEPIEWIVLYNENGDMYLLSKYVLDVQPFNGENKKACSLDDWLKTTFYQAAFEKADHDIISRVCLLPEMDIDKYQLTYDQLKCQYTAYAMAQEPYRGYTSGYMWWLTEETLSTANGDVHGPVVWENGNHGMHVCDVVEKCGVRPTIWLFADPDTLPAEPVFDGSGPVQSGSHSNGSGERVKCAVCNGTGSVKYYWGEYDEGTWGKCTSCNGTGWD